MKPQFQHDHTGDRYLGTIMLKEPWDLYYADKPIPTLVARYGDDGPEYVSGLAPARMYFEQKRYFHALAIAYMIAKGLELVS